MDPLILDRLQNPDNYQAERVRLHKDERVNLPRHCYPRQCVSRQQSGMTAKLNLKKGIKKEQIHNYS